MITPITLQQYTAECVAGIPALNYGNVVIDDSQLTRFLEQRRRQDNRFLIFVVPEYPAQGNNADDLMFKNEMLCMILEKTDASNIGHDDFLLILENTLLTMQSLVAKLQADKLNPMHCPMLRFVDESSFYISPVWNRSQCHGWQLEFHLKTPFNSMP